MGLFGSLFDLNGDGKATEFEELMGLHMMQQHMKETRRDSSSLFYDDCDLDHDELDMLDEDGKAEYLEENGYDPEDFHL